MSTLLIHIGYHKSGTTFLQRSVFSDPAMGFVSEPGGASLLATKEIVCRHPFSFDARTARNAFASIIADATSQGKVPVISQERLVGDPERGRYDFPIILNRLQATFGDLNYKILITIREQKQTILALYRQHVRSGGRMGISEFIRTPHELPGWHAPCDPSHLLYDQLFDYLSNHIDTDRILVLPLEMLRTSPDSYFTKLFTFAGLDRPGNLADLAHHNVGLSAFATEIQRQINWFGRTSPVDPKRTAAVRARRRIVSIVDRLAPRAFSRSIETAWSEYVGSCIGDYYVDSNRRTKMLCDLDLGMWGYDLG